MSYSVFEDSLPIPVKILLAKMISAKIYITCSVPQRKAAGEHNKKSTS